MTKKFSEISHKIQEQINISDKTRLANIETVLFPLIENSKILSESLSNYKIESEKLFEAFELAVDSAIDLQLGMTLDHLFEAFNQDDITDAVNTIPLDVEQLKDFKLKIASTEVIINWEASSGKVGIQVGGKDVKNVGRSYDLEALIGNVQTALEDWDEEETSDDLDSAIEKETDEEKRKKLAILKTIIVPRIIAKFANSTSDRNRLVRSLTAYITKGDDEEIITNDIDQRAILDLFFDMLDVITSNKQLAQLLSRNSITASYDPITESILLEAKKKKKKKEEDGVSTKLDILLKLGLVDTKLYSRAKKALGNKKAAATIPQLRNILFDLLDKLVVYIKKDPTIYNRLRINVMKEMKGILPTKVEVIEAKKAGMEAAKKGESAKNIPEKYTKHYFTKEAWLEGFNTKVEDQPAEVTKNEPEVLGEEFPMGDSYTFWGWILGDVTIGKGMLDQPDRYKGRIITPQKKYHSMKRSEVAPGSLLIPNKLDRNNLDEFYHLTIFDQLKAEDATALDTIVSRQTGGYSRTFKTGSCRFLIERNTLYLNGGSVNKDALLKGLSLITQILDDPQSLTSTFPKITQIPKNIDIETNVLNMNTTWDKHVIAKVKNKLSELNEEISYTRTADKVIANLTKHDSATYTRLANKIKEMQQLEEDIKKIRDDIKQATREDIQALFEAEDSVMTRVVETTSFTLQLSKDPKPTETVKYQEVLKELANDLTPDLIKKLEELKKKFTSVTQKAPSLTLKEGILDTLKSYYRSIVSWAKSFDNKLAKLKKKSGLVLKEARDTSEIKGWMSPTGKITSVPYNAAHHEVLPPEIKTKVRNKSKTGMDLVHIAQKVHGYARFGKIVNRSIGDGSYFIYIHFDKKNPSGIKAAIHALEYLNAERGDHINIITTPDLFWPIEEILVKGPAQAKNKIIEETNMKTFKKFVTETFVEEEEPMEESIDISEIDLINDVNEQLQSLSSQTFETKQAALEAVKSALTVLSLTFDVESSLESSSIELEDLEGSEAGVTVFSDDESLEDKVEGEISLKVSYSEVDGGVTIIPELMVSFDEDEVVKLSDIEFEVDVDADNDSDEEEPVTEEFVDGKTFNVILFRARDRRIISLILKADSLNKLEKQVESDYPDFEINQVFPVKVSTGLVDDK
jgi:CRISPR/Cas system CMR-associated protein Cmr5 small subunit